MKIIEPIEKVNNFRTLEVGDILVYDKRDVYVLIYNHNIHKYAFHSLGEDGGAWNGQHTTLEILTVRIMESLENMEELKLYRSSEYDLQVVPKS